MVTMRAARRYVAYTEAAANTPIVAGKRTHARARLNIAARMTTIDGTIGCTLIDVSCSGAKLSAARQPSVGAMTVVEQLPVELFGVVRWSRASYFGIEFDKPLPFDTVVALRRYAEGDHERCETAAREHVRRFVEGTD